MDLNLSITITGKNPAELAAKALATAKALGAAAENTRTNAAPKGKISPKAAAAADDADDLIDDELPTETDDDEAQDFMADDDAGEEIDDEPAPVKTKGTKAKKLTEKDVNEALMKHAKKTGDRKKTLAILVKKFKVKSVLDLKPEQYAEVIAAFKV